MRERKREMQILRGYGSRGGTLGPPAELEEASQKNWCLNLVLKENELARQLKKGRTLRACAEAQVCKNTEWMGTVAVGKYGNTERKNRELPW